MEICLHDDEMPTTWFPRKREAITNCNSFSTGRKHLGEFYSMKRIYSQKWVWLLSYLVNQFSSQSSRSFFSFFFCGVQSRWRHRKSKVHDQVSGFFQQRKKVKTTFIIVLYRLHCSTSTNHETRETIKVNNRLLKMKKEMQMTQRCTISKQFLN